MCGLAGYVAFENVPPMQTINAMIGTLAHRGPNGLGTHHEVVGQAHVSLGHSRLAIQDLSDAGSQPMHVGHHWIVFNGEVYNFKDLRSELEQLGRQFRSDTDTEVVVQAFDEWGPGCVDRFIGMFAFVIIDEKTRHLHAFRDRSGVKPFFFVSTPNAFIFASELKAFQQHPEFDSTINVRSLPLYFDLGYLPGEQSIFSSVEKLKPGHRLSLDLSNRLVQTECYWHPRHFFSQPKLNIDENEALEALTDLCRDAFDLRMVSDVPVGVFLSGGYDSTAVTALLQANRTQPLKTFTIGFEGKLNEAPYAREIAAHLGTDHHELVCTEEEALSITHRLPEIYDEPFADSSSIPTVLVSEFAKQTVTVALSADGGDESFAGYDDYGKWRRYRKLFEGFRHPFGRQIGLAANLSSALVKHLNPRRGHHLKTANDYLSASNAHNVDVLYRAMRTLPESYANMLLQPDTQPRHHSVFDKAHSVMDDRERPQLIDLQSYLPDDILVKVDRATMSTSLEGREPLLDHRIIEWTAQLPFSLKVNEGTEKYLLKKMVHQFVPQQLLDRPKKGFSVPLTRWLRGELSELLMDYVHSSVLQQNPLIRARGATRLVNDFMSGRHHESALVWKILMLLMWQKRWC